MKCCITFISRPLLALGLVASFSAAAAAQSCDPWDLSKRYGAELKKLQKAEDSEQFFGTHLQNAFGVTKDSVGFLNDLTGGTYAKEMKFLLEQDRWKFFFRDRWSGRMIKQVEFYAASGTRAQPLTQNINDALGKIGHGVTALTIASDIYDALQGDDAAKIKAVVGTGKAVQGWLINQIGSRALSTAMGGVAFIDYALNRFIGEQQRQYHDFWWNAYSNYMEKKYPQLVTGGQSWTSLVEQGGADAVQARLDEFWADTGEGGPMEKAALYYRTPGPFQRDALAIAEFRKSFGARYYRDSLHKTMKTYFRRQAEEAQIQAALKADDLCDKLRQALSEMNALKEAVAWAKKELDKDDAGDTTTPPATGIQESILLVLDASGSMRSGGRMDKAKRSAAGVVGRMKGDVEVALIVFYNCGRIVVAQGFTTDRKALEAALKPVRPSGSTPLAQAVAFADDYLAKNAASPKQKLVVLTDGKETCGGDPVKAAGNLPTR